MNRDKAKQIVNAIFDLLSDRGNIGDVLESIKDDTVVYEELYDDCVKTVRRAAEGETKAFEDRWDPGK